MLYGGGEMFGFKYLDSLEKLQLKYALKLEKNSTATCMERRATDLENTMGR